MVGLLGALVDTLLKLTSLPQQGSSQDKYGQSGPKHCKWTRDVKILTGQRQAAAGYLQSTAKKLNSGNH